MENEPSKDSQTNPATNDESALTSSDNQIPETIQLSTVDNKPKKKLNTKWKIIIAAVAVIVICTAASAIYIYALNKSESEIELKLDTSKATSEGKAFVVNANNKFAFDLYSKLDGNSNLFFSPYSITSAVAVVYDGAKGKTAEEIKSVFHFPNTDVLKYNYAAILNSLNQQNDNYELKTTNDLWVQKDYQLMTNYTNSATKYYGAKVTNLDFTNNKQESIKTINDYISKQTNDKIKNIIDDVDEFTKVILTNAIYFKGDWLNSFDKNFTQKQDFRVSSTNTKQVDMMGMNGESFNYFGDNKLQIIELPYKDNKLSMLVMLPKNDLDSIKSNLTADQLNQYRSKMSQTEINSLKIPKVKFDTKYDLVSPLGKLGMTSAFSSNANLSGINGKKDLKISDIIHKAYIDVNEQGTEAAAATAIVMANGAAEGAEEPKIINFIADHPYVFLIQDNETGNILFLGKVSNPTN